MAWELKKVEDQRKELVEAYLKGVVTMTELCTRFGVSRKTAYKWLNRYKFFGIGGLKDHSKAPHDPNRSFSQEDINMAIDLKLKHRTWGPKKVLAKLNQVYPRMKWPSPTRLYEIFKEQHLVTSRRIRNRVPATHPLVEVNGSNDVWTADFKGWFLTQNHEKCEPFTITDGFSRYLIRCDHLAKKSTEYVWPIIEEAFREYGLPHRLRTDNGPPFGSTGVGRLTQLSINLIKAGVIPEWINPGHPEENGRHERFHSTLKQTIADPPAATLQEQLERIVAFQEEYNFERPHEALNMSTPASCYQKSTKIWDGILRAPEYDTKEMDVRKVGQNGGIWFKQAEYYLGSSLTGEYVGLKEGEEKGKLEVYYGPVYLGKITVGCAHSLEKPKMHPKKIVRRG
jgi:putative transposase